MSSSRDAVSRPTEGVDSSGPSGGGRATPRDCHRCEGTLGYDLAKVRQWAAQGDCSDALILVKEVSVAEAVGQVTAWASLIPRAEACWLDDLWVGPEWIGTGIGSLFRHALNQTRQLGATWMEWEAEPNATGFYEKMGGRYRRDSQRAWRSPSLRSRLGDTWVDSINRLTAA
jgi:GNAT superfamily N-acetyltransferase